MAEEYAGVRFDVSGFVKAELPAQLMPLAREIEDACGVVEEAGLAAGIAGNLSIRCETGGKEGQSFLITPTGTGLANVKAREVALVRDFDFDSNILRRALGLRMPSSETPMHSLIYSRMPGVNAIAHLHADSLLDEKNASKLGITVTERALPYGTKESALAASNALEHSDVIIMRGHGVVAVGSKIGESVAKIINKHAESLRI
ncbi:MAG: class II aldolase/adducin family protein [Candidatus Burarchaeum sp.]|nr:class II aldolase/adducin family protein [Candidatus Burarchaeum sp.]MDO8339768.1 class II aldolase/adducin family protein [Candidatus Burarchaeum sp.]